MKQQSATIPIAGHKPTSRYLSACPDQDYFRLADNAELTQRQGQAYSQRSESPRFPEESLRLGMRAAVDQVL
jgi:hypothetical protein